MPAVFIVSFLAIHPFQDGNGRLSRIVTTLILLRTGYEYVPYISLESIIEENKNSFYVALRETQKILRGDGEAKSRRLEKMAFVFSQMSEKAEGQAGGKARTRTHSGAIPGTIGRRDCGDFAGTRAVEHCENRSVERSQPRYIKSASARTRLRQLYPTKSGRRGRLIIV